jgi:hypothetical protein
MSAVPSQRSTQRRRHRPATRWNAGGDWRRRSAPGRDAHASRSRSTFANYSSSRAVTDGSLTENPNKTGVRLWTDPTRAFATLRQFVRQGVMTDKRFRVGQVVLCLVPATSPSPPPRVASQKTLIKLRCGCGAIRAVAVELGSGTAEVNRGDAVRLSTVIDAPPTARSTAEMWVLYMVGASS